MINLEHVSFSYGKDPFLRDLSFHFEAGKFYGIFGKNGSGKSTVLKLITGECSPSSGTISPGFRDPLKRAEYLSFMEQGIPAHLPFTVEETVLLGSYARQKNGESCDADPVLELLQLQELRNRCYSALSGGEKQRVMLARILMQQTPVILLDEPFSSFDIGNQHLFYGILRDLAEQGKCIIMVSHDVFLSGKYLDTAVFLKDGTVYRSGAPGELLTESFLSQIYF